MGDFGLGLLIGTLCGAYAAGVAMMLAANWPPSPGDGWALAVSTIGWPVCLALLFRMARQARQVRAHG
jgi:hypothetical protein